jgi:hypothetical protein
MRFQRNKYDPLFLIMCMKPRLISGNARLAKGFIGRALMLMPASIQSGKFSTILQLHISAYSEMPVSKSCHEKSFVILREQLEQLAVEQSLKRQISRKCFQSQSDRRIFVLIRQGPFIRTGSKPRQIKRSRILSPEKNDSSSATIFVPEINNRVASSE